MRALDLVAEICTVAIPDVLIQPIPPVVFAPARPCVPNPCQPLPEGAVEMEAPLAPKPNGDGSEQPPKFSESQVFAVQHALVEQCERRRDRIALLDPPFECVADEASGLSNVRRWRARFESKFAALYWPWPRVVNPIEGASALLRPIPPSGHVAGRFAATDEVGVHRAPCNSALAWSHDVTLRPSDETHDLLNSLGVNVIVATPSRGIRIMGARTTSSDPDARYLNVRRPTIMIVKALDLSKQWAVFEPNHFFEPCFRTFELRMGYQPDPAPPRSRTAGADGDHLTLMMRGHFTTMEPTFSSGATSLTVRGLNVLHQLRTKPYTWSTLKKSSRRDGVKAG